MGGEDGEGAVVEGHRDVSYATHYCPHYAELRDVFPLGGGGGGVGGGGPGRGGGPRGLSSERRHGVEAARWRVCMLRDRGADGGKDRVMVVKDGGAEWRVTSAIRRFN